MPGPEIGGQSPPDNLLERSNPLLGSIGYIDRTLGTIEANLALDEALLVAAEERGQGPVLRVWEAPGPAVVLGASSRLAEDVDVELCRSDGVPIARRSSGGGTVVVGPGALNVTVVLPANASPGLTAVDTAQAQVLGRLARSVRGFGPPVGVQGSGDLTLGGRKFAGSAQRRLRRFFLVHASILYNFPIDRIVRYTRLPRRQPSYRARRSHEDFLTNLPLPRTDLLAAVRSAWRAPGAEPGPVDVPHDLVNDLVASKFGDPSWVTRL
jgi:lipoate-protein ligase A